MISSIATSLGYGSGLDIAKLVTDLAAASRDPKVARFDKRSQAVQSSISAVAQARSDLEGFATSLSALVAEGSLQSQPSVSDTSILDARSRVGSGSTSFSGSLEVTQLARGQSLASNRVASTTSAVGQGSLTLTVGATTYPIAIGASNDSLSGLAAAINAAQSGVTANVVSDAQGARLVLKGPTGSSSIFQLSSSDPGLSDYAYPGAMTLVQTARDATFTIDGLSYSRPTNTIDDAIDGLTLTLKKIAPGQTVTLGMSSAHDAIKTALGQFVSVFNTLKTHLATARTATRSDQGLRVLDRQLSQMLSQPVSSGLPGSLTAIGIKTNRDGTIALDDAAFEATYAANPAAVETILSPQRDATHTATSDPGIGGALAALKESATDTNGVLAGLSSRLGREAQALADDRLRMETRETAYKARLEKQFGSIDTRVGALKATQSYLDQQIKVWTAGR